MCYALTNFPPNSFKKRSKSGYRLPELPSNDPRGALRGCRFQGSVFRVQGSGFRVQGSGFRVQGSEFRV